MTEVYVRLPKGDLDNIHTTLNYLKEIAPLSLKELHAALKEDINRTSNLYKALLNQLLFAECINQKRNHVTYFINGHSTIGIGLDLTSAGDGGLALFYNAMEKYDWITIYPKLQINANRPNDQDHADFANGLSDEQVDTLFYWTLIGANYTKNDKPYKYVGIIESLIKKLAKLANEKFAPYQLIALISMAYHSPALIGNGIRERLAELQEKKYDGSVLLEIIEASNETIDLAFQNRLLHEAGLFHGNPEQVQLNYRQCDVLTAAHPTGINWVGGTPGPYIITGLETSYTGDENYPEWISGSSKYPNSKVYFGKNGTQTFEVEPYSNNLIFTGCGNKEIHIIGAKGGLTAMGPTTIVDNGVTHYQLHNAGNIIIYATEGKGTIDFEIIPPGENTLKKYDITAPAISTHTQDDVKHFSVLELSDAVTATYSKYLNKFYSKLEFQVKDDTERTVTLMNFKSKQFGCTLIQNNDPVKFDDIFSEESIYPKLLKSGSYVSIKPTSHPGIDACIYDSKGNKAGTFTITDIKIPEGFYFSGSYFDADSLSVIEDNQFVLAYQVSMLDSNSYYNSSLQVCVCSTEGVINTFTYSFDVGTGVDVPRVVTNGSNYIVAGHYFIGVTHILYPWVNGNLLPIEIGERRVVIYSSIGLNNGNFALLFGNDTMPSDNQKNSDTQQLIICILNPEGILINTLYWDIPWKPYTSPKASISALGKEGFLLTTLTTKTDREPAKIFTQSFDGISWSETLENHLPHDYRTITNIPYIDDYNFLYLQPEMYVYKNTELISRNGGNIPFTYAMKIEGETYVCETRGTSYSRNPANNLTETDKEVEEFHSVTISEADELKYAEIANKLQENASSKNWGFRSLFSVFKYNNIKQLENDAEEVTVQPNLNRNNAS